jgi:hypothetical protein
MNAEGSTAGSEEVDAAYAESITAFGDVNRHNANTFQNMSAANTQLINNVMPVLQQLQQQVQGLAMAARAQPPGQAAGQVPYQAPPPMQYIGGGVKAGCKNVCIHLQGVAGKKMDVPSFEQHGICCCFDYMGKVLALLAYCLQAKTSNGMAILHLSICIKQIDGRT